MIMTQSLVLNIAEFDQTAKIHVSMLKDMITKDSALFRTPYKRAPESHPFYCSFISTSNASDLLRDHTGNRRFIIFEVDSIDWSYAKRCEAQLLAQYHSLYKSKFRASQEANDAMTKFIGSQTPDNPEDLFIDEFQDKMRRENKYNGNPYIEKRWEDISDWAIILGKSLGLRERQMQMAIKRRGMSKKIGRHMFYVVRNDELAN